MTYSVTNRLCTHYQKTFEDFGVTPRGVDWRDEQTAKLRYQAMLNVTKGDDITPCTLLDVGCGYGGLLEEIKSQNLDISYKGVDVVSDMIKEAKHRHPKDNFQSIDVLELNEHNAYDYVVCNGILTQKLDISLMEMDVFAKTLIKKMFDLCQKGCAFNVMTTYVNFFAPNLYYKHPCELMTFCLSEITHNVKIDHSYGLYEYTIYLYK